MRSLTEIQDFHHRRDLLGEQDSCRCGQRMPCDVVILLAALREPRDLERAVVEAALTAVTTWRTMQDERTSFDQWWDVYVEKRDALIDAVDALLAAREPRP